MAMMKIAAGSMFVRSQISREDKEFATHVTECILNAFVQVVDSTTGMDDDTKDQAKKKVKLLS